MQHITLFCVYLTVLSASFAVVTPANILDLLWNGAAGGGVDEKIGGDAPDPDSDHPGNVDEVAQRSCACSGPACMCCVDFNLTYVDLGGPGCVHMKYVSQNEGIAVNVSYGDDLLHTEQVKGPNPKPTCTSILTSLAQVCARFVDLLPHGDGLRGCLLLEPKLLGAVTTRFNIGCFTAGPKSMELELTSNSTITTAFIETGNGGEEAAATNESGGFNEEELIAAVNETAEQGLAFFGNLLGLTFGKPEVNNTSTNVETTAAPANAETS